MITKKHSKQSGEKLFEVMGEFIKPVPKDEERFVILLLVDNHTFKKKVEGLGYKVIDVGNGLLADYNISVSNFKQEFNDVFSIINKDRGNMKIDYIITNPPYDGDLYLKILSYIIESCKDSEIISINPNRPLVEIIAVAGYKKNSDFSKYENSVYRHIKSFKFYTKEEFDKIFNISFGNIGAIYQIKPEETFDVYKTVFQKINKNGDKIYRTASRIFEKVMSGSRVSHHFKNHENGNLVALSEAISGWSDGRVSLLSPLHLRVYNSKIEFLKYYQGTNKDKKKQEPRRFLNFRTRIEAQNFIDCYETDFMKIYIKLSHYNYRTLYSLLPLLDMTQKWTNEKLCEYYNVSKEEFNACLEWYNS